MTASTSFSDLHQDLGPFHRLLAHALSGGGEMEWGYLASRLSSNCSYQVSSFVMPGLLCPVVGLVGESPTPASDAPGTLFFHLSLGGDV